MAVGIAPPSLNVVTERQVVCGDVMILPGIVLKTLLASLLLAFFAKGVVAQTGDACHVYVLDIARSSRAFEAAARAEDETAAAKALSAAQTVFPEFRPTIGEEELTTRHYSFPGARLIITASVFYTDESMVSHRERESRTQSDSIVIGIVVSNRKKASALDRNSGSAIAEATYDEHTNKLRAKQYVKVRGRMYLVGIECDCMAGKKPK